MEHLGVPEHLSTAELAYQAGRTFAKLDASHTLTEDQLQARYDVIDDMIGSVDELFAAFERGIEEYFSDSDAERAVI